MSGFSTSAGRQILAKFKITAVHPDSRDPHATVKKRFNIKTLGLQSRLHIHCMSQTFKMYYFVDIQYVGLCPYPNRD